MEKGIKSHNGTHVKVPTIGITNPSDKMPELMVELYDGGDRIAFPLETECVDFDVIVRKPLNKVQHKHWRHSKQNMESQSGYMYEKVKLFL